MNKPISNILFFFSFMKDHYSKQGFMNEVLILIPSKEYFIQSVPGSSRIYQMVSGSSRMYTFQNLLAQQKLQESRVHE